jgi:uncharacterized membrane protein YgdD (TMEM256/DUF423 family)
VAPNGLEHRRRWLKRAWEVWGDPQRPKVPEASSITRSTLKELGSDILAKNDIVKTGAIAGGVASGAAGAASESGTVVTIPNESTTQVIEQVKNHTESVDALTSLVSSIKSFWLLVSTNLWVIGIVLACVGYYFARKIDWSRLLNARTSTNIRYLDQLPVVEDTLVEDPDEAVIPRA